MTDTVKKILVVDDEQDVRIALYEALTTKGYDVAVSENGVMGLELARKNQPSLVISDIDMPEMDGIELLKRLKELQKDLPVIMMSSYGTIETAVTAIKHGAFDYLLKPFSTEIVVETVNRVIGEAASREVVLPLSSCQAPDNDRPIIGQDPRLLKLLDRAKSVASSKATVLILGESGTGKELIARYIHHESDRTNGPFVALNCAALPDGLLESELFGHEKGAFTGAFVTKKGKFELADGGTLLLDELGEIPLHLQAKLLRVLQEEEVDRLGGKAPHKIDVHVVATTNRELQDEVNKGNFRQDLFYRLNVIPLRLPALRDRRGDILLLADYFIGRFSRQYQKPMKRLSKASADLFVGYSWPGNVREMENLLERAVLLAGGDVIEPWDFWDDDERPAEAEFAFPPTVNDTTIGVTMEKTPDDGMPLLRDVERQMILQSLRKTDNNRTHAAKMLGISVRTLRNKLHEYRNQGLLNSNRFHFPSCHNCLNPK